MHQLPKVGNRSASGQFVRDELAEPRQRDRGAGPAGGAVLGRGEGLIESLGELHRPSREAVIERNAAASAR